MTTTKSRSLRNAVKKSSTSTTVPKTIVEQATLSLKELPEKPKENLLLREAVEHLYDSIVAALAKGYSHEDVAGLLTAQGVTLNVPSLKYYLARLGRRKAETPSAKRKPRQAKEKTASSKQVDEQIDEQPNSQSLAPSQSTKSVAKSAAKQSAAAEQLQPVVTATSTPETTETQKPASRSAARTKTKAPTNPSSKAAAKTKPTNKTSSVRSRKKL